MYWLRAFDPAGLALYACLTLLWAVGGTLLAARLFDLHPRERLLTGLALGFVGWISAANLLAAWMPLPGAAWAASGLIFAAGIYRHPQLPRIAADIKARRFPDGMGTGAGFGSSWKQLAVLAGLTLFFSLCGRGISLFDDYLHLPLVSVMATGDFPPHFYLNPDQYFAYHYALQVWAASLVRMAGLMPWSAWDIAKGLALALTAGLAWLWLLRQTASRKAALAGALVLVLGGGTRWLLPLLPDPLLDWLSRGVTLINTGADTSATLTSALGSAWVIEGGGRLPFPFAFHNGVFVPVISVLGATGALPFLTVLLLLLLAGDARRGRLRLAGGAVLAVILANLALSAEHLFAFLWAGLAGLLLAGALQKRLDRSQFAAWAIALVGSALLSLVQGGFITEAARGIASGLLGLPVGQSNNFYGFALRWPPAVYSAHLGLLSLFHPGQVITLLFELGPGLLLAPLATALGWGLWKRGAWLPAGLAAAALINFFFPLLVQYGVDRSITRMPGSALWLWLLLALPALYALYGRLARWGRLWLWAGWVSLVLGGAVMLAVQAANIPSPQLAYFISGEDSHIAAEYWNRLEPDARILDRVPYRAVTVFGRPDQAHASIYEPLPEWLGLTQRMDPVEAARAGYDYLYLDGVRWEELPQESQARLLDGCVRPVIEVGEWVMVRRYLLDIRGCR